MGVAYFGTGGGEDDMIEITALGDEVKVVANLASRASAGEIVLSESTVAAAALDTARPENRALDLKGKSEPMDAWVMTVTHVAQAV